MIIVCYCDVDLSLFFFCCSAYAFVFPSDSICAVYALLVCVELVP